VPIASSVAPSRWPPSSISISLPDVHGSFIDDSRSDSNKKEDADGTVDAFIG
jgi:hypothetical protein